MKGKKCLVPNKPGKLEQDFDMREVRVGGKDCGLAHKEFELVKFLREKKVAVKREEILDAVWGIDKSLNVDTRTVDQHIARLRKKIGAQRIKTITLYGYIWKGG